MKQIILASVISLTFFAQCSGTSTKEDSTNEKIKSNDNENQGNRLNSSTDISFDDYLKKIGDIKLPLNLQCENPPDGSTLDLDPSTIDKFGPENSRICGKIAVTKEFSAILYLSPADIVLPIIQTTDRNGNKIAELSLYERWCGEDEFSWGTSWAKITSDLTITLSDSAIIYKRDSDGKVIEDSKKTEVRHRIFNINNSGQIIAKKNEP